MFLTVFVIVLACMFFGVGRIFEVLFTLLCALVVVSILLPRRQIVIHHIRFLKLNFRHRANFLIVI